MNFIAGFAALLIFALFDYVGYNTAVRWGKVTLYRIVQTFLQLGLTALLWWQVNGYTAFLFNWLWWFWLADLLYYFMYDTFKWFGEEGMPGTAFTTQVLGNQVVWAWWTPSGLLQTALGCKSVPIPGNALLVQAMAGLIGGIFMTMYL